MGSLRWFILVLVLAALAGCSGDDVQESSPPPPPRSTPPTVSEVTPEALVRIVDGDTRRAVKRAVVRVRGSVGRSGDEGVARLEVEDSQRVRARISAPGYMARRVTLPVRTDRPATVHVWRRNLQWPLYGANAARTQTQPANKLRPPFRVVWRLDVGSLLEFPATVWEGVGYLLTYSGRLRAISMKDGDVLWRRQVGRTSASSPAVDSKRRQLVVTTKEPGQVKIIDMDTGKVRWSRRTARVEASPVIAGDIAYFGDDSGRVYALDLERRKIRWVFSGASKITSSATLAGGRLYFGDYAGRVFALSPRSGRRLWTGSAGTRVYGTVAAARGRVFAPSVFSGLSALSARSGRLLWRVGAGAYVYSSPAYYKGRVYFGSYAGVVYCVNERSGRVLWRGSTGGSVSGAVVVVGGVVYAGSFNSRISAFDWRSGRRLWAFSDGRYVPVSGNGGRLLMHGARTLYGVAPKRG
jgi:outer membrane protein assembly factor BamB